MKRLFSVWSIVLVAVVLGSVFLVSAGGELRAEEPIVVDWDGDPSNINVRAFLCDMQRMQGVLEDDADARVCVVNALATNEAARKMIIQKMLKNSKVRGMIMDSIVSNPELRAQMEQEAIAAQRARQQDEPFT